MKTRPERYQHKDRFEPIDYTLFAKSKLSTMPESDQEEIKYAKQQITSKIHELGNISCDELLLKLGSFLNQNGN